MCSRLADILRLARPWICALVSKISWWSSVCCGCRGRLGRDRSLLLLLHLKVLSALLADWLFFLRLRFLQLACAGSPLLFWVPCLVPMISMWIGHWSASSSQLSTSVLSAFNSRLHTSLYLEAQMGLSCGLDKPLTVQSSTWSSRGENVLHWQEKGQKTDI